jgi:hypothetical protein
MYSLALIMILIIPFVHSSISILLDDNDSFELVENGQDEESNDEENSEEEGIHGIEEFLVHGQEAYTFSVSKNVLALIHGKYGYTVFQDLITPPPRLA